MSEKVEIVNEKQKDDYTIRFGDLVEITYDDDNVAYALVSQYDYEKYKLICFDGNRWEDHDVQNLNVQELFALLNETNDVLKLRVFPSGSVTIDVTADASKATVIGG